MTRFRSYWEKPLVCGVCHVEIMVGAQVVSKVTRHGKRYYHENCLNSLYSECTPKPPEAPVPEVNRAVQHFLKHREEMRSYSVKLIVGFWDRVSDQASTTKCRGCRVGVPSLIAICHSDMRLKLYGCRDSRRDGRQTCHDFMIRLEA